MDKKFVEDKKFDDKNDINNVSSKNQDEYINKIKEYIQKDEAFRRKSKYKKCNKILRIYRIHIFILALIIFSFSIFTIYKIVS